MGRRKLLIIPSISAIFEASHLQHRLLYKWGFSPKVPRMRFVNAASKEEKGKFRKKLKG
jgi:hypothetical protein